MNIEEIKKEAREKSYHTSTDYCERIDLKDLFEILDKYKEKECDYKKYKIDRGFDVNSNDKLETQDRYSQQLYDAYLDLRIKYNDLQSQLDIANKKLNQSFYQ